MRERWFCKHIGALMLALPEGDAARGVLEGIRRQQWESSQYSGGEGHDEDGLKMLQGSF